MYLEHTRSVARVRWNPNLADEFASVSADGLTKLWDCRTEDSVATLTDPENNLRELTVCEWHKGKVRFVISFLQNKEKEGW